MFINFYPLFKKRKKNMLLLGDWLDRCPGGGPHMNRSGIQGYNPSDQCRIIYPDPDHACQRSGARYQPQQTSRMALQTEKLQTICQAQIRLLNMVLIHIVLSTKLCYTNNPKDLEVHHVPVFGQFFTSHKFNGIQIYYHLICWFLTPQRRSP